MSTFSYTVDFGVQKQSQPKVLRAQFGDGYMQRQRQGLNNDLKTWTVKLENRTDAETAEIEDFFAALGGADAFRWTPPDSDTEGSYICSAYTKVIVHAGINSITATFEEVAEP